MLNLKQICSIYATDKNCLHSYVDNVYEELFEKYRYSAEKILEIGVDNGGSMFMWREYFEKAIITGIDNKPCSQIENRDRINFINLDAYDIKIVDQLPNDFDIIIDDGPHTLESMTFFIKEYINKIKEDGILVVEDIQDFNWTNILRRQIPKGFYSDVRDLRKVRNRYDDILMIIRRA
jgi:predicted methyltransferase